ncbi:MAG: inorganic diphosphatase [Promethearchaeota archaeon]
MENPKGCQNKFEISKTTNLLKLDRVLHSSVIYPQDYGFIPGTYVKDGDPLDILVLISHSTYPKVILEVKPISVLLMEDQKGVDEKNLAVSNFDRYLKLDHIYSYRFFKPVKGSLATESGFNSYRD